jgi:hypothetical protein
MGLAATIVTSITAAVMAVMPASCSKTTAKSGAAAKAGSPAMASTAFAAPATDAATSDSKSRDLGELALTNNYELEVTVAHGKTCLIVPKVLDRKTLQLTMSLRTRNASGKVDGLSVKQITGDIGKPFEVAVGDMDLTLTPEIVQE